MTNPIPQPQIPMVDLGNLYVNGLVLSNDATFPHVWVDVSHGQCRDSTNTNDITVGLSYTNTGLDAGNSPVYSTTILNIDASGVNGLDIGAVTPNTMYAVYAIGSSTNSLGNGQYVSQHPGAVIMSLSFVSPVLPAGYDMFRRIGAIMTDNSTEVIKFLQNGLSEGRLMWYDAAIEILAGGDAITFTPLNIYGTSPATSTAVVPPIATAVYFQAVYQAETAGNDFRLRYHGGQSVDGQAIQASLVATLGLLCNVICPCSADPAIDYMTTQAGDSLTLYVSGYLDYL